MSFTSKIKKRKKFSTLKMETKKPKKKKHVKGNQKYSAFVFKSAIFILYIRTQYNILEWKMYI